MSREKDYYQPGDTVKRNDNGHVVLVLDVKPIGFRVFYNVEDLETGRISLVDGRQLRPNLGGER